MVWIQTSGATRRLYDADLDVEVTFNENGTSQVAEELAAALCDRYEAVEPYEAEGDDE